MEKIYRISFLNIGKCVERDGQDFFDCLKPGVAVLFGDDYNFICYYQTDITNLKIDKIDKVDVFEDWISMVAKFFNKSYKIDDEFLLESLVKSIDEEDEDGFYEYIGANGGEVVFENPNSLIEDKVDIFIVKQMLDGIFSTDGKQIEIDGNKINLKELTTGYFDDCIEISLYWKSDDE